MLMFKRRRSVFALIGALIALAQAPSAPAQTSRPRAVAVGPQVWMVQGQSAMGSAANRNFISNAGFVITSEGVLVIDALGSPDLARELRAEISRITDRPVTHVVVTHYHADHIYGLQVFKDAGAQVIAHRHALQYLHSDAAQQRLQASREELFPWVDENTRLVGADRWVDGTTTLRLGGTVIELHPVGPAHTLEDLAVWLPGSGVLFAGDLVFRGRIPFVGQADSAHWVQSLDTLLAFDPRTIVPGHGPATAGATARTDLQLTRDYLLHLRDSMGEAARNLEPFDEAYARTDWSRFEKLPLFGAANRMNAYNTYLLMERTAK